MTSLAFLEKKILGFSRSQEFLSVLSLSFKLFPTKFFQLSSNCKLRQSLEILFQSKMGNKEAKFKKVFEEIDASGDGRVSLDELENFLDIDQNPKIMEVFLGLDHVILTGRKMTNLVSNFAYLVLLSFLT